MRTSLPIKSEAHELRIREIVKTIVKLGRDKIAFVILFGAFADGTWVRCRYVEDGLTHEYASDYNFLVITKGGHLNLERKIKKEIDDLIPIQETHRSYIIIESLNYINDALKETQPFFSDAIKEGVLFYDSGEFKLTIPKESNSLQKAKIAKADYYHWLSSANGFLTDYRSALERNDNKKAAFYLHQSVESFYSCTLFVLGGYKPKSHDLEELNQICVFYSHDFLTVFPKASLAQRECFELLSRAYIDARYSKSFYINRKQLEHLATRIEYLKNLVEKLCSSYFIA